MRFAPRAFQDFRGKDRKGFCLRLGGGRGHRVSLAAVEMNHAIPAEIYMCYRLLENCATYSNISPETCDIQQVLVNAVSGALQDLDPGLCSDHVKNTTWGYAPFDDCS
jgi:hypothetical protein